MGWLNENSAHSAAQRGRWVKRINAQIWRVMGRSRTATFLRLKVRRWRRGSARVGVSVSRNQADRYKDEIGVASGIGESNHPDTPQNYKSQVEDNAEKSMLWRID
jgi:hypothetical protein